MATYTDNYALTKPTMSELADIRTINGNMDTVDEIMHGSQVSIADAYDPTQTYAVDDLVMYDFLLYKCITAVSTPEAFDANKWTRTTAAAEGSGGGGGGGDVSIKATLLWEGNWDGTTPLQVDGLSDWLLIGYTNYESGIYLATGTVDRGISGYGIYRSDQNGMFTYRFGFNSSTNTLTVDNDDRGFYFGGSTTYQGGDNCNLRKIYGLIKKPTASGGIYGIDYSTTEQNTGRKWIDGKDVYQIVISDTMPTAVTEGTTVMKQVSAVSNVDTIVSMVAVIYNGNSTSYIQLPYITDSGSSAKVQYDITNGYLKLYSSVLSFNGLDVNVIMQYTKSTS